MELDDLGAEFRRKLRDELERVANASDADAAVDAARESDDAVPGVTDAAGIGEARADVSERALAAPLLRLVVVRADGQRQDLGTVPMKLAASADGPAPTIVRTPAVTRTATKVAEDARDSDETSELPGPDAPHRSRGGGLRARRRQPKAVVSGGVEQGDTGEDELTFGDKARWIMGALRKDLGRAATAAQAGIAEVAAAAQNEIAEAAARRQDRKEQAAAEVAAAEAYFDSLPRPVQEAVRGLLELNERRRMGIINTYQIGEYRKILRTHGYDINPQGYLIETPGPVKWPQDPHRRPRRPPEDTWPNRNPGYRTGPRP